MIATMPQIDPNGRYNASQASKILDISRSTFYRYVRNGLIRANISRKSVSAKYLGKDLLQLWRTI